MAITSTPKESSPPKPISTLDNPHKPLDPYHLPPPLPHPPHPAQHPYTADPWRAADPPPSTKQHRMRPPRGQVRESVRVWATDAS